MVKCDNMKLWAPSQTQIITFYYPFLSLGTLDVLSPNFLDCRGAHVLYRVFSSILDTSWIKPVVTTLSFSRGCDNRIYVQNSQMSPAVLT